MPRSPRRGLGVGGAASVAERQRSSQPQLAGRKWGTTSPAPPRRRGDGHPTPLGQGVSRSGRKASGSDARPRGVAARYGSPKAMRGPSRPKAAELAEAMKSRHFAPRQKRGRSRP